MRRGLWLAILPSILLGQAARDPAPPIPADRRADSYAIYSAALARPSLSHPDHNQKLLIEETSGLAAGEANNDPQACIQVPEAYRSAFREALADRVARYQERYRLEREFAAAKPYVLVTGEQAEQFRRARETPGHSTDEVELFRGATDLITLGNVYFDRARSMALVYTWAWCGSLCGYGDWRIFLNRGRGWEEQSWLRCATIAGGAIRYTQLLADDLAARLSRRGAADASGDVGLGRRRR